MNESDYTALLSSLNQALAILERNRTPDPAFVAGYDTLKQSRAMLVKALDRPSEVVSENSGLAAA